MKKTYIVVTPIKVGNEEDGKAVMIPPGEAFRAEESEVAGLLACNAIRASDIELGDDDQLAGVDLDDVQPKKTVGKK